MTPEGPGLTVDALLALCTECPQPMTLVEGVPQHRVEIWVDESHRSRITPHTDTCDVPSERSTT